MVSLLLALIYISFVSLGLPDAVLGASWPVMHPQLGVQLSDMGILSMTISLCTIVSSLNADRLTGRFGTARVTAFSVGLTAVAILGFSWSGSFLALFLWAIPYGLGAGGVDASLNNYVATHYASRHMSWLHCMWGIGACTGPYVMSYALLSGATWNQGYRILGIFQALLCLVLFLTLKVWRVNQPRQTQQEQAHKPMSLKQIFAIPGVPYLMFAFFGYCAVEQTAGQWASSYLVLKDGMDEKTAAGLGSLFYLGITAGRAVSGFLTLKMNDRQMIRLSQGILFAGITAMLLPFGKTVSIIGLLLIGLGCAPIYPCVIHSTPILFGADKSQAIIGVQMAFAYVGTLLMPPLYGLIAQHLSAGLLPGYLLALGAIMLICMETLNRKHKKTVDISRI